MRRIVIAFLLCAMLDHGAAADEIAAHDLFIDAELTQGGYAVGSVAPGSRVSFDGRDVTVGPDGRFVIGFHRDDPEEMVLEVTGPDGTKTPYPLAIEPRDFDIQRIDGLEPSKVTPPEETLKRIRAEAAQVRRARKRDSTEIWFDSGWIWPAKGRISGVFGSQRILNGKPRQPHYGVDIAAPTGTEVVAPADGVVSLVHEDMYYSGGTMMIDHGRGFASAFLHMQEISVQEGQHVRKGDRIGTVGATGRATGPHLDWRINWFDKRLDAALFVPPMEAGG